MALEIIQARFTDPAFARCLEIRLAVFVGEQNVPEAEERDTYDATARHFLALVDGTPAGTARLLDKPEGAKITRVAVLRAYRGQGIGEALMRHIEALHPTGRFMLDAQVHAQAFYARLGYAAQGAVFLEAGIAHVHMSKQL
jgi:ElaA protein